MRSFPVLSLNNITRKSWIFLLFIIQKEGQISIIELSHGSVNRRLATENIKKNSYNKDGIKTLNHI